LRPHRSGGVQTDREDQLKRSNIGYECDRLARYDRRVAAALFEPIDSYLRSLAARMGPRDDFDPSLVSFIAAKGSIEPRSAVAFVESVTPPRGSRRSDAVDRARIRLAVVLGQPLETRWRPTLRLDD
jgi:hypothetical protein